MEDILLPNGETMTRMAEEYAKIKLNNPINVVNVQELRQQPVEIQSRANEEGFCEGIAGLLAVFCDWRNRLTQLKSRARSAAVDEELAELMRSADAVEKRLNDAFPRAERCEAAVAPTANLSVRSEVFELLMSSRSLMRQADALLLLCRDEAEMRVLAAVRALAIDSLFTLMLLYLN